MTPNKIFKIIESIFLGVRRVTDHWKVGNFVQHVQLTQT